MVTAFGRLAATPQGFAEKGLQPSPSSGALGQIKPFQCLLLVDSTVWFTIYDGSTWSRVTGTSATIYALFSRMTGANGWAAGERGTSDAPLGKDDADALPVKNGLRAVEMLAAEKSIAHRA